MDDPLKDPENKLAPTVIHKINNVIKLEIFPMVKKGGYYRVVGTPQTNHDFFFDKGLQRRLHTNIRPAIKSEKKKEVTYEKVTAKELIDTLQNNALKAKENFKDKYVEITGRLNVIDASGAYITVNPLGDDFVLTGVQAYIKTDEQKQVVSGLSKGDKITVKGKIKDVGEVLGYSVDIDEISKTAK